MEKKILILCGLLISLSSCMREENVNVAPAEELFYATTESYVEPETRVYADKDLMVLWNEDDRISIFKQYTYNQQYRFLGKTGANSGAFSRVPGEEEFVTGNEIPSIYAVYPYDPETEISNQQVLSVNWPATQTYAAKSFGRGANVMVSATNDNNLRFKNAGGYLMFKFYGDNVKVKSIKLSGNNHEKLAGAATIQMPVGELPVVTMASNASEEVTLSFPNPVRLGSSESAFTECWLVLPPVTFSKGITVVITDNEDGTFRKTTSGELIIERNALTKMAALKVTPVPAPSEDAIVFADAGLKAFLLESFDTNGDGEISYREAANVTNDQFSRGIECGPVFSETGEYLPNEPRRITYFETFDELQYFTGLTRIPDGSFNGWWSLRSVKFPPTVTEIGGNSFSLTSFTDLDLPENIRSIGNRAFEDVPLKTVIIRCKEDFSLDEEAFGYAPQLDLLRLYTVNPPDIRMPIYGLGGGARFQDIDDIQVPPASVNAYKEAWFTFEDKIRAIPDMLSDPIPFADASIKEWLVKSFDTNHDGEISYSEANAVTSSQLYSYFNCSLSCEDPVLPAVPFQSFDELQHFHGLTTIPEGCFSYCTQLKSIRVPVEVTGIGLSAFEGCSSLESFRGTFHLSAIDDYVFYGCEKLQQVILPTPTLYLGSRIFSGCNQLELLKLYASTPPEIVTERGSFPLTAGCRIVVPSVENYLNSTWSVFADQLEAMDYSEWDEFSRRPR